MIHIRLQFVLSVYDDLDGAPLTGPETRFVVDGRPFTPRQKEEGWYVFAGLEEHEQYDIQICRRGYCPSRMLIHARATGPPVEARLIREDGGFSSCNFLRGSFRPFVPVYALFETERRLLALSQGEEADRIALVGYDQRSLTRQRFCLGEGDTREIFLMRARQSDGSYLADIRFKHQHKAGEPVLKAYHALCREDGTYSIPVDMEEGGKEAQIIFFDEERQRWDCLSAAAHS